MPNNQTSIDRDIAIIGMACRFPDANNPEELFHNLRTGKDSLREISAGRIRSTTLDPDAGYRVCGYLEDIDKFDHAYFNISMGEAKTMDPHQRIMLEVVNEAFEDAGCPPGRLSGGLVSVYVADTSLEYYRHADEFQPTLKTGNVKAFLGAWISKQFDLRGAVAMIDTSCSSSLVAVHLACNDLILGDADYALACGVNLDLFPLADAGPGLDLDSPDGRSHPFSKKANGMSFGEGVACVLLKPYSKAVKDKDIIHAVIKASAVNNNSSRAASLTAPDSITQCEVISRAWEKAGISAAEAGFIEAHGSGTQLGDSIEIGGLDLFFRKHNVKEKTCAISTIKSNIGHTRAVAGLAGLIKAVLSLHHRVLFPLIGFDEPNPLIDFDHSPVFVIDRVQPWEKAPGQPRYAGVSSIGLSGTNCHVVLREELPAPDRQISDGPCLVPLSAKSPAALENNLRALLAHLMDHPALRLKDIAYTLAEGRTHHPYRVSLPAIDLPALSEQIAARLRHKDSGTCPAITRFVLISEDHSGISRPAVEYLSDHYPVFKEAYASCLQGTTAEIGAGLADFAFQYSLYQLLKDNGLAPTDMVFYGVGKILRLVLKEEISLEEGVSLALSYAPLPIDHLEARVEKLLEAGSGPSLFFELGIGGEIGTAIRTAGSEPRSASSQRGDRRPPLVLDLSGVAEVDPLQPLFRHLYEGGRVVAWNKLACFTGAKKISLPAYRFEKTRCWIREEPRPLAQQDSLAQAGHPGHLFVRANDGNPAGIEAGQFSFIERKLLVYWKRVLPRAGITVEDNFFETGGDSLKATKLINHINDNLGTRIDFEDIFDYPDIRSLAAFIDASMSPQDKLALYWKEVLDTDDIGPSDNFFDLGGHSLNASQVLKKIAKELNLDLSFEDFYRHPTLESLAGYISHEMTSAGQQKPAAPGLPIGKAPQQEYYALSHAQQRLWLLSRQHNSSVAYNQPEAYRLTGPVMVTALQEAFEAVVSRHESLRTTFHLIEGEPRQRIEAPEKSRFAMEIIDVRGEPASRIQGLFNENALTPFDFGTGPLLRVQLLVLGSDEYLLFVNLHHIISDEWSFGILIREITALYSALRNGGNDPLPPLFLQYKDYCAWHNQLLEKDWLAEHRAYWLKQFEGALPLLDFPSHKRRPAIKTFNAGQLSFTPAIDTGKALLALAKQEGATPFMACLALIKFMLYRYTGQPDIIVGCPVAGRQHTDLDGIIGFFVNLLPLRTSLAADGSFRALLQTVRKATLAGFDHQVYPFDLLVGELNLERDPSRSPLFDVGFTWHAQADAGATNSMGVTIEEYETGHYTVKTDLWFHGYQSGDALTLAINYNTDLFTQEQMTDFMRNTEQALAVLIGDPDSPLHSVNFLSTEEYRYWIVDKNRTATLYPDQATIPGLFEEQVDRYPEKTALVFKNKSYTYLGLNAQVNRLARYMVRHHGLVRGERVGLWVNRNELAIIGLLAILKAGGVYVPVDPEYPTERVRKILADVSPKLILTESCLLPDLPEGLSAEWMALDLWADDEPEAAQNPLSSLSSRDLAYIMYTSGSTGIPKGVCVEHRSVIRLVRNTNYVKFGPDDRLLQIASFAFDGSVFDIFGALLNGAALYILDKESILSSILFVRYVKEYRTNMMFIPTSLFHNLVDTAPECISLFSTIVFGGERAIPAQIRKALPYRSNRNSLVNGYGPTENTTFSACFIVDELSENILSVPVGLAVSNSKVFILDPLYQPVPAGVEGEVYLGGDGLARGYWNNDAATAGSFITISFLGKQERLYKTGDIGKWLPDGNLDLLGRKDHQVKIRGHRIELGEIENLLLDLPPVRSVYLRVLESPQGEKQIVAYLVVDGEQGPLSPDYRQYLERHVPLYMIPSYFIQVPAIPLNVNGKVDEKGLPDPARDPDDGGYEAPSGAIEEELARIWQEQLGVERPGVRDNFFALGGDSIKAIRLISAINVSFNKLLDINDIFTHVDISSLAQRILESDDVILHRKQVAAIRSELNALKQQVLVNPAYRDRIPEDYLDIYPMSDIEIGIIYHSLLDRSAGLYHDQLYYQFGETDFSLEDLRKCLGLLVARHELLRTSFHLHGFNFPLQIVHQPPAADPEISLLDLRYLDKEGQQQFLEEYLAGDRNEPFVFTSPGLWRIRVFRLSDREYGLLWVVHHAIIDGWSNASFITELSNGMASIGKNEPFGTGKLKATYKDFIIDQLRYERHSDWRSFWPAYMAAFNRTRLPLQNAGRQTGPVPPAGESVILLNAGLSKALHKISRDRGIGLRELFLAAFTWLLKMTTHSEDITIGLVTNARPVIEDGDKMIGCFLNTVPYRVCLSGRITGAALIDLTHAEMNRLKPHEMISLQKIIELVGPERLGGTEPVFNMAFGYLDFHIYDTIKERTETADQLIGSYTKTNTSLDFVVGKTGDQFSLSLNYTGGLYEEEDIRRLEGYYEKILYHIAFQPDTVLENINIIGEQEKAVLLQQFNLPDLAISNKHTIQELFGTIAAARPGATALVLEEGGMTYHRLNELSNQLAHYLRNKCQVGKGQVIALMPDRSEWMVIGMLGILKSGACFLPVDPAYPPSRKEYMLTDSGAEILLTAGGLGDNDIPANIQVLDMRSLALGDEPSSDPSAVSTAQDLAYVLYTSGSTGKPKGAMIGHRNFVNMILYLKEKFFMEEKDRVVQFASVSFDACVYETFLALLSGAGLILLTSRIIFDLVSFISYLKEKKASVALLPPVYLNKLELGNLHFMRVLVTGGEEAILRDAVSLCRHLDFYNAYGPTECAVIATLYKAGPDLAGKKAVPIGRPIANTCIYILDKEGQLLPVGVEGEICISGDGVGRGYLHAPELTATRFVEDPFRKGVPLFRTGDKGFYHKDGTIEFAGRNDEQLKINGYRIEPEEIRAALMRHPSIRLALVLPATDAAGEKTLNAYYHAEVALSVLQLRQHLEQLLPSYMIPARFIGVEGFPLTNNGKIDVKILEEIGAGTPADKLEFTSPENEIEENLVKVWRRVLRRDVISVYDNYFELGGSSVKLIEVFNILKKEYAYKIEIADFFKAHTIRLLSRLIEEKNELVPREDNNLEL